ncbi:hypothetical protein C8R46DRAFT_1202508 [Mycena filopes]|nr:hypothetical protein C8R46DRAFT_1202508 [Mycena filopes]
MSQRRMNAIFGRPPFTIFIIGATRTGSIPMVATNNTTIGQVYVYLASLSLVPGSVQDNLYLTHGRHRPLWSDTMPSDYHFEASDDTVFAAAAHLAQGDITAYRQFAFPPALADPHHDPFFSVKDAPFWITSFGYQLWLTHDDSESGPSRWSPDRASIPQLEAYQSYIIGVRYLEHSYFGLENPKAWINPEPFDAYMSQHYGPFDDTQSPGSRASSRVSFLPSSRASSPASFALSDNFSRPSSSMSMHSFTNAPDSDPELPDPNTLLDGARRPLRPADTLETEPSSATSKGKGKSTARGGKISITRLFSVDEIIDSSTVKSTWSVPRTSVAVRVDLSQSQHKLTLPSGRVQSLDAFIRAEDQDSWGGSSGHSAGDAQARQFSAAAVNSHATESTRVSCSTPEIFAGCERFEPDVEGMQELWRHELDSNEREAESAVGILARFYTRITNVKCTKPKCNGVAVLKKLSNKKKHSYWPIPNNIDEGELRFLMDNNGLLPPERQTADTNPTCVLTAHPRIGLKHCLHDIPETRNKALVILRNPHNHPMHPKFKPSTEDRVKLGAAVQAAGLTGLTAMKLLNATSTSEIYGGNRVAQHSPAFASARKVRDFVSSEKKKAHPRGMGWEGVHHRMSTYEIKLPKSEHYIHVVMAKNGFKLVVTMHPQIVMYIHRVLYLVIDYTFKRVEGELDEWEVAAFLDRFNHRLTFASLYCDTKSPEAFEQLFTELFAAIASFTGETFKLAPFFPDGKCRVIILDGEVAQAQGFGRFLVKYNDPKLSGITTRDPIEILSSSLKTCSKHFERHIDELPNDISTAVIHQLKSILWLKSQDEIDEWHRCVAAETHPSIQNWYHQKLANPWILPSVNKFLSRIPADNWDITPNHSNLVETAHAARNAETAINVPLLTGIMQAQERDNAIAAELLVFNDSGVMRNRFNGVAHREKLSDQRKVWRMRKTADRNNQITGFEALTAERENGNAEHKESIACQAILEGEVKALREQLQIDKRRTDLQLKINDLRKDIEEEKVARRDWVTRRGEIKVQLTELRDGPLAGTRINGRRPAQRPTGELDPAAEVAGLGDGTAPDEELLGSADEFIGATYNMAAEGGIADFNPEFNPVYQQDTSFGVNLNPEFTYFNPEFDLPYQDDDLSAANFNPEFTNFNPELNSAYENHDLSAPNFDPQLTHFNSGVEYPYSASEFSLNDSGPGFGPTNTTYPMDDPMNGTANSDLSSPVDFLTEFLANTASTPEAFGGRYSHAEGSNTVGTTYDLPHLGHGSASPHVSTSSVLTSTGASPSAAASTSTSIVDPTAAAPTTLVLDSTATTTNRKRKAKEPEVDERDIIVGGRAARSRTKNAKTRAEL